MIQLECNLLKLSGSRPPNGRMGQKTDSDSGDEEQEDEEADSEDAASRAIDILAGKLAVDTDLLMDECEFASIGLDSFMSLIISQKLQEDLDIEIRDALYLEVSTIGGLKRLVS